MPTPRSFAVLTLVCVSVVCASAAGRPPSHGRCDCPPGEACPSDSRCKPKNVLWLPLGDSITWGCNGPTIQDCHLDSASYRIPLALALSQHPLSKPRGVAGPDSVGFNISTMGTLTTGPPYVPSSWLKHEGHPGWQINTIDGILNRSLATSPVLPDLVTIHLGTNDCDAKVTPAAMVQRMDSLLGHLQAACPKAQIFLADVIATGERPDMAQCIKDYNKLVPGVVSAWAAKGMKIYFVAANDAMNPGCGDTGEYKNLCGKSSDLLVLYMCKLCRKC